MNKFLKLLIIPVSFLVVGTTSSCSFTPREIALVTAYGDINDGSFNQESYEACKDFATANHKSFDFYRPFNDSEFGRLCAVKQAVAKGAKVVILPGFQFAITCAKVMKQYPNTHFLLIDTPISGANPTDNACCIGFRSEYAGFSAGYSVATDLLKRDTSENGLLPTYGYGYCGGMASPGTYEFGFGYIQGICQATADFCNNHNLTQPNLNIWYNYAQVFAQSDAAAMQMKQWLANDELGIKVLFPCGGKLYQSATEAVNFYNKHQKNFNYNDWLSGKINPRSVARWIGVDSDQYHGVQYDHEKRSIYTSALKGLKSAIKCALKYHFDGKWGIIGGFREERAPTDEQGEVGAGGQWILGINSIFGDNTSDYPIEPIDFVGIPDEEYDEDTKIIRGFDMYKIEDYEKLQKRLKHEEEPNIEVYGGNGVDCGASGPGIPDGMESSWKLEDGTTFRTKYLGDYQGSLTIKYI